MSDANERQDQDVREDEKLVRDFLSGNSRAFDLLVVKYKDTVFNLCYRYLGSLEDADDGAQETFVKIYRSLRTFRFESRLSTWIYRIALNTCRNRTSSKEYRQRASSVRLDVHGEKGAGMPVDYIPSGSPNPGDSAEHREEEALIQEAIDSLAREHREVVVLRDIEGRSYEEISHITGHALGTVKSKIARARQQLRKKLEGLL